MQQMFFFIFIVWTCAVNFSYKSKICKEVWTHDNKINYVRSKYMNVTYNKINLSIFIIMGIKMNNYK